MADMEFGTDPEPASRVTLLTTYDLQALAPLPRGGQQPAVQRLAQVDGVNLIAMTFTAGQALTEHRAAHPITVQAISGRVHFTVGSRVAELTPGHVVHLPAMVTHRVDAIDDSVVLLSMYTGEGHSSAAGS